MSERWTSRRIRSTADRFTSGLTTRRALRILTISGTLLFITTLSLLHQRDLVSLDILWPSSWSTYRPPPLEPYGRYDPCPSRGFRPSEHLGGPPAFKVFNHLWYHNESFYFAQDHPSLDEHFPPDKGQVVMPDSVDFQVVPSKRAMTRLMGDKPIACFSRTTAYNNDPVMYTSWHSLAHYFHFVGELLFGSMAALFHAGQGRRNGEVLVPRWVVVGRDDPWKDGPGLNEQVAAALFRDRVVDQREWEQLSTDAWVYFAQIVITDRRLSTTSNPLATEWNKMILPVLAPLAFPPPPPTFFDPARRALFAHLGLPPLLGSQHPPPPAPPVQPLPKILYISRQGTARRLDNASHHDLLDVLREMGDRGTARTQAVRLEGLEFREQVRLVREADVHLGVHGNGLTHDVWRERGVVVEIFLPGAFQRDYEAPATVLGHRHLAVWNDTVHSREIWETHPDYPLIDKQHVGAEIPLDKTFIRSLLHDVVHDLSTVH